MCRILMFLVTILLKLQGFHKDLENFKVKFTTLSLGMVGTVINGPAYISTMQVQLCMGRMLLIITDSHLKRVDVRPSNDSN